MELELQPLNLPSDKERLTVIAGPCSAETEEQVMSTAMQLAAMDAFPGLDAFIMDNGTLYLPSFSVPFTPSA